ncbi:MAG: hypothetical protein WBK51_01755 [Polaromonas sp.]
MRTTFDLPDSLFRMLKARAAMDGSSLKDLLIDFIQRGLNDSAAASKPGQIRSPLPVLVSGAMGLTHMQMTSNAELYKLMYEQEDAKAVAFMHGATASATEDS